MRPRIPSAAVSWLVFLCSAHTLASGLTGLVRDQSGADIPGAIVLLQSESESGLRYATKTDPAGVYRFSGLRAGAYKLEISMAGFKPETIGPLVVPIGENQPMRVTTLQVGLNAGCGGGPLSLFDLRVLPGIRLGNLAGTVKDREGRPIKEARVLLVCAGDLACSETRTNAQGEFRFANIAPDTYAVRVERPRFYSKYEGNLRVRGGLDTIYYPVRLEPCRDSKCDPALEPAWSGATGEICM